MSNLIIVDGINVRRDMAGRYCLNDLHRAAGGKSAISHLTLCGWNQHRHCVQKSTDAQI